METIDIEISFPGPGINDAGYIAYPGNVDNSQLTMDGGVRAPEGDVTNIGSLGGRLTTPADINNAGQVIGSSSLVDESVHAFMWDAVDGMRDLTPNGVRRSDARAVNAFGDVVGTRLAPWSENPSIFVNEAVVWKADGSVVVLPTLPGYNPESIDVYDINDQGQVVGYVGSASFGPTPRRHVVWDPVDGIITFDPINGAHPTLLGLNNEGMVVGFTGAGSSGHLAVGSVDDPALQDTGIPIGNRPLLNEAGHVLTNVFMNDGFRVVLWDSVNGLTFLSGQAGDAYGLPVALNDNGLALGKVGEDVVLWTIDWDDDLDGIGKSVEDGAPNGGDGNNDGIADAEQPEVASLRAGGTTAPYITVVGPPGTSFIEVEMLPPPATPPPGVGLPLGLLQFELHDVPVGGLASVQYLMPSGAGVTEFWQYDGATWTEFAWDGSTGAQISGTLATLTYEDGGRGDLDGVANGVIVDPIAAATPLSMSIGSAAVVEGDSGKARTLQLALTLSEPATSPVTVNYTIVATGSATSPVDFDNKKGRTSTVKMTPSAATGKTATVKYVSVKVAPDTEAEGDESFAVELSNPTGGYGLGDAVATAIVIDDDPGTGNRVGIGDSSIYEGDAGVTVKKTNNAKVWISLSSPATATSTVTFTVTGDNATVGTDFKAVKSKVLTFNTGQWQKPVTIPVFPDISAEDDETVTVTLTNPSANLSLGKATGTVSIVNDD